MSGWAQTRRLALEDPWSECWIEANPDPQYGLLRDLNAVWVEALSSPTLENVAALVAAVEPLLAAYHIPGPDGAPIRWALENVNSSLVRAVVAALSAIFEGGGTADPLTSTSSPSGSSAARRSRRSTASGS